MTSTPLTTIVRGLCAGMLIVLLAGANAQAQQASQDFYTLNNRLSSLQDQIFRLQDQITANKANRSGAPAANINPTTAAGLSLRIDSIEQQLRGLTGTVERMANDVRRIDARLKRFSEDAEFRFRELEGGSPGAVRRPARPRSGGAAPKNLQRPGGGQAAAGGRPLSLNRAPGAAVPRGQPDAGGANDLGKAAPPQVLGQIPAVLDKADIGEEPKPGNGAAGASFAPPRSDAGVAYEKAYEALLRRRFNIAESGFKGFLRQYPNHDLAGNAQYWLGESYYARGRFREAAGAFVSGYRKYKNGRKAPDSLLKLAMTLNRLGQKSEACSTLDQLAQKYPRASKAVRNRAKVERRNSGC